TGTGTSLDRRQARLAQMADAIVVRDEGRVFDFRDVPELLDHPRPILAVLQGLPTPAELEQPDRRPVPTGVLVGLVAAIVAVVAGVLIYLAVTGDDTDVAESPPTDTATAPSTPPATQSPTPATDTAPPPTQSTPPTTAGGFDFGIPPELLAAPTLTVGDTVVLSGAVRTTAKAQRMADAAEILADGAPVDDQLITDPGAARWTVVRIDVPMAGLRQGDQFSAAGQRWADAIAALIRGSRARVLLTGGTSELGPAPIERLLDQDLRAKGFDPVIVRAVGPGSPTVVLGSDVDSPDL
ncbi:MAG: hypothetical protein OES57_06705, partial [Acidimicrobiia bacterium]|nr:hypothetical protein [Acidimicrobiia bacterium]